MLPAEEQRALFKLLAGKVSMSTHTLNELKRRCLTPEKLQAEQEARAAAEQEAERQRRSDLLQKIRDKFADITDGKFASVLEYMNNYRYRREAVQFLRICVSLIEQETMSFRAAQNYIAKIKESDDNDADLDTAC